jgi:hypothetical protein
VGASWRDGCELPLDVVVSVCHCACMDELPLNDQRRVEPKRNSKEWRVRERKRYIEALRKFDGVFPPYLTAWQLGVSRQRVYQMFDEGILERLEFFGHAFARGDEIDGLQAMHKERQTPGFRWGKVS